MDDLLDDLTAAQLRDLLKAFWVQDRSVTRANVKAWRRANDLPVSARCGGAA